MGSQDDDPRPVLCMRRQIRQECQVLPLPLGREPAQASKASDDEAGNGTSTGEGTEGSRKSRPQRSIAERNQLIVDNLGLAGWVVKRIWHKAAIQRLGWDECFSEACLAMLRAAESWVPERGEFQPYATRAMFHAVFWLLKQRWLNEVSIDESLDVPSQQRNQDETFQRKVEVDEVKAALLWLPPKVRKVMWLTLRGRDADQVSKAMGLPPGPESRKAVWYLKQDGFRRIREFLTPE